jgi:hypothetical protein
LTRREIEEIAGYVEDECKACSGMTTLYIAAEAAVEETLRRIASPVPAQYAEQDGREIIRELQKALFYWMPCIAGEDSPAGQKAAEHSYLLVGLDDNSTECWGDQILHYVGTLNREQEKLGLVLSDAGCTEDDDYLQFIENLAARAASPQATEFKWPPLPALPNQSFYAFDQALFTEHQMQGYANAYGEAVRAAMATATQPAQTQVALTDEQIDMLGFMCATETGPGSYKFSKGALLDFARAILAAQPAQ